MNNDTNLAIEAKALNKTYLQKNNKNVNALIDFNINVPRGVTFGLLGPNGAGKSTFINILAGLVKKNSGEVKISGLDIDKHSKKTRNLIGIVPQELNMDPFFTPFELLEMQCGLYGIKKKNRKIDEILERVGLINQKNAYARSLSGGMKRRLLIAKALIHNPEVVILDEPTAGVDVELRKSLWKYIKELNENNITVCLTTHYLYEAQELCDYIAIINNGKIIISESRKKILDTIKSKTVYFYLDYNLKEIPDSLKKYDLSIDNKILKLKYEKGNDTLNNIIKDLNYASIKFKEINTYDTNLEDVFTELTKNN